MPYGFRAGEWADPTGTDGAGVWTAGATEPASLGTWLTLGVTAAGGDSADEEPHAASTNNTAVTKMAGDFIVLSPGGQ
jgi:hypothetical protein